MSEMIVDSNVLVVANDQSVGVSEDCTDASKQFLGALAGVANQFDAGKYTIATRQEQFRSSLNKFAQDILGQGVPGMSTSDTRKYLEFVADQRLLQLGLSKRYGAKNPFAFMELQGR